MSEPLKHVSSYDLALRRQQALRDGDRAEARVLADELDRRARERRQQRSPRQKIEVEA